MPFPFVIEARLEPPTMPTRETNPATIDVHGQTSLAPVVRLTCCRALGTHSRLPTITMAFDVDALISAEIAYRGHAPASSARSCAIAPSSSCRALAASASPCSSTSSAQRPSLSQVLGSGTYVGSGRL